MQTITSNADSFGNVLISIGLQNRRPLPWWRGKRSAPGCRRVGAGSPWPSDREWRRWKHRYGGACRGRRHAYGHNASFTSMVESFSLSQ